MLEAVTVGAAAGVAATYAHWSSVNRSAGRRCLRRAPCTPFALNQRRGGWVALPVEVTALVYCAATPRHGQTLLLVQRRDIARAASRERVLRERVSQCLHIWVFFCGASDGDASAFLLSGGQAMLHMAWSEDAAMCALTSEVRRHSNDTHTICVSGPLPFSRMHRHGITWSG